MELPRYETLLTEMAEPHVLVVTLNRPEVANALNTQMGRDFLDLWTRLTEDAGDVRCVVLTGAGDRVFCAGGDLKERNGMTARAVGAPARTVRAPVLGADRPAAAGDRGGQRPRLRRRLRNRAVLRFRLRGRRPRASR